MTNIIITRRRTYLWSSTAFVPSDEALPNLAVPFRNDSQTFSLPLEIPGNLPLRIWTFSSAEKQADSGVICSDMVFSLRNSDPIASSWNYISADRLMCRHKCDKGYYTAWYGWYTFLVGHPEMMVSFSGI